MPKHASALGLEAMGTLRLGLTVVGAGLLWGATLTDFSIRVGVQGPWPELGDNFRIFSAALYVAMFLTFLFLFRNESRIFSDARWSFGMVGMFGCGIGAQLVLGALPNGVAPVAVGVGLTLQQIARSYLNFAVFYLYVRMNSHIRFTCVALSAAIAVCALSGAFSLSQFDPRHIKAALAVAAGLILSLRVWLDQYGWSSTVPIDLHAPHVLPIRRWAFFVYGVCTAALPNVQAFVLHPCSPNAWLTALLFACVFALLFCGVEKGRGFFSVCAFVLGSGVFFACTVLRCTPLWLLSCGYIFTYLGTCVLFSYGVPSMSDRWYADPMAVVVMGYATGWVLGMVLGYLPITGAYGVLMAKSLVASFFGVLVPLFALGFDRRRFQAREDAQTACLPIAQNPKTKATSKGSGDPFQEQTSQEAVPTVGVLELCDRAARTYALTQRETQVLGYMLQGFSEQYIADALVVSKTTVHTHVRHIYAKMDVHSHDDLSHKCYQEAGEAEAQ